ncbi:MAG TPA: tetratricopeptide repeat protein [Candidatus Saccharimonadales bacterium]|nr:tetratricopeptide repeat protein [Candidatus Saccharimonadales bacterium]
MDDNTVHIGTGGSESWWRRLTKRAVLIPFFALLIVGGGLWAVANIRSTSEDKGSTIDKVIKASDLAYQTGDYQKSLRQLEQATGSAQTKEEKVVLYSNLAAAAASSGEMKKAIDYLNEKHSIAPETEGQDAYLLGSYYERSEDNAKAVEYYKKAIDYLETLGDQQATQKISSLKVRIESLEGGR